MLNKILEIGPKLAKLDLDIEQFATESEKILKDIEISSSLEEFNDELARWMLENKLPKQLNVYNAFGQPPVTVFSNDDFVVDLYFWMHADTSIHSHAFSGGFKVLFGKSLHETFNIDPIETYSVDVVLNDLKKTNTEILTSGDSRKIITGNTFNHRVVHLSSPTVTLCIRTISDDKIPQWHYFDNGLSILKRELDESIFKKLFYSDYMFEIDEDSGLEFLTNFIESLEGSELINLFEQLSVDTMGLNDNCQAAVYDIMMAKLNTKMWFELYESHCEKAETFEPPEENTEISKFESHATFYQYSNALMAELTKKL